MNRYLLYKTYRLGVLIDHIKTEDVIREIDDFIGRTPVEEIPHALYILSLTAGRRAMLELLTDLAKGVDEELPSCIIVGLLHRDQDQYTTKALYGKIGLLVSLLENQESDLVLEFTQLKEAYDKAQEAYGLRFKRKKARERMLAKNEKALKDALQTYAHYVEELERQDWGS